MNNEISLNHKRIGRQYLNLQGFYILPFITLWFTLIREQTRALILKRTDT